MRTSASFAPDSRLRRGVFSLERAEEAALGLAPAKVFEDDARRDGADPGIERAFAAELADGHDELDERELPQIFVVDVIPAKESEQRAIDLRPYPVVEGGGDALVARAHRGQELAVVDRGRRGADRSLVRRRRRGHEPKSGGLVLSDRAHSTTYTAVPRGSVEQAVRIKTLL